MALPSNGTKKTKEREMALSPQYTAAKQQKAISTLPFIRYKDIQQILTNATPHLPGTQPLVNAINAEIAARQNITAKKIFLILTGYAARQQSVYYSDLGEYFVGWGRSRKKILSELDVINKTEYAANRPMITSLIIRRNINNCGAGFYNVAREMGYVFTNDLQFETKQRSDTFKYGKKYASISPIPYT